jgi:hypothetical protein
MPTYENSTNTGNNPDWKPGKPLPKLTWTAADERNFLAKKARQEEKDSIKSVGQVSQMAFPDRTPAEALIAWAFKK